MNGCVTRYSYFFRIEFNFLYQRVLLSLFVAVVVAVSEAVLYLIWQSRKPNTRKTTRRVITSANHKKGDADVDAVNASAGDTPLELEPSSEHDGLRRRRKQ